MGPGLWIPLMMGTMLAQWLLTIALNINCARKRVSHWSFNISFGFAMTVGKLVGQTAYFQNLGPYGQPEADLIRHYQLRAYGQGILGSLALIIIFVSLIKHFDT